MKTKEIQSPTNFQVWYEKNKNKVVSWLDGRSELFSKIAEEPTTRRTVIRVNLISLALMLGAVAAEQQPLVSVVAMVCAGYLVKRLNGTDNKK
ncbi:MAG: Tat pathway signal protein [Prevotella bivia]|nr:Tat pathway signal protein [Prevotella bivia]